MQAKSYKLFWIRDRNPPPLPDAQSPVEPRPSSISPSPVQPYLKPTSYFSHELPLWKQFIFFTGSILAILAVPANVLLPLLIGSSPILAPTPASATYDVPTGTIILHGGNISRLPGTSGQWLYCDGSAVSRTTYSNLFTIIGVAFGVGDGVTTFNLPDFRNRFPMGTTGSSISTLSTGGSATVTLTINQLPPHTHGTGSLVTSTTGAHTHPMSETPHTHSFNSNPTAPIINQYYSYGTVFATTYTSGWNTGNYYLSINSAVTGIGTLSAGDHTHIISGSTASTGNGDPVPIIPPYQTVHFIIRT